VTEFVVDASLALALVLPDEQVDPAAVAGHLASARPVAPQLFGYEVANALTTARRRGRLTQAQAEQVATLIDRLGVDLVAAPGIAELATRAREWELSAYDASYLLLALQRGCPLATRDGLLAGVARAAGVPVLAVR
jgi:predicted nucleic acid-binding protein